jgi:G3E family GTPase
LQLFYSRYTLAANVIFIDLIAAMLVSSKSNISRLIPTNIITGFLGVGKTTAIRQLLTNKPKDERWSVLVNEFGEIGIDGALLQDSNAQIREVPGGCICCVADLPMRMALNMLISKTNPDRILIEPTGLGHPADIINSLTGDTYQSLLDLRATITLIDPRKLRDSRYTENAVFQDQIAVADVLIANKNDLLTEKDREAFQEILENSKPAKQAFAYAEQGQFNLEFLNFPRQTYSAKHPDLHQNKLSQQQIYNTSIQLPTDKEFIRRENASQGFFSCGWMFKREICFDFNGLFGWMTGLMLLRAKAVMNTDQGIYMFNAENGVLSVKPAQISFEDLTDSRIELINDQSMSVDKLETELLALITGK